MSQFTDKEIRTALGEERRGLRFYRRAIRNSRKRGQQPARPDVLCERSHHIRTVALQRWLFDRAAVQGKDGR